MTAFGSQSTRYSILPRLLLSFKIPLISCQRSSGISGIVVSLRCRFGGVSRFRRGIDVASAVQSKEMQTAGRSGVGWVFRMHSKGQALLLHNGGLRGPVRGRAPSLGERESEA